MLCLASLERVDEMGRTEESLNRGGGVEARSREMGNGRG